jgi:putative pyoverdin transport system ATP-binding/permease protein
MQVISFLLKRSRSTVALAVLGGIISGASNVGLIALVHTALSNHTVSATILIWSFVGLCITLPLARVASQVLLTRLAQGAMFELRMELSRLILAAPLRQLEEIGTARLMATLTDDVQTISQGLVSVPVVSLHASIVFGSLIYLGWLSWAALLGVLIFLIVGVFTFNLAMKKAVRFTKHAREEQDILFNHLRALTQGTKELKLHRDRREAFLSTLLQSTAASYQRHNVISNAIYTAAGSGAQLMFFILIGLLVFALPNFKNLDVQTISGFALILLYMVVPLDTLSSMMPNFGRASVALKKVISLGLVLEDSHAEDGQTRWAYADASWESLELRGVTHTYHLERENSSFCLGPIDLTLSPGELVFLVGGNGSGKTTLAKLLVGLYAPESGEIRLNGQPITNANRDYYGQHFSVVFSDFYLFDSLLGLNNANLDYQARDYLVELHLDHKVQVKDGTLSTIDLSQGQRKRLALLTAYLEDRPIYVFDEWAADQDPVFKDIFYLRLLPELKAKGKTVLIISHDDRYYHVADRIIKLDYGKIAYDNTEYASPITASRLTSIDLPVATK